MPEDDRGPPHAVTPLIEAVCRRCLTDLPVDHASVALASGDGLWTPVVATSAIATELEQKAFALGEGPYRDALHRQTPLLIADVMEDSTLGRWPFWVPAARATGVRAVNAVPIQTGAVAAGVLTLLSTQPGALAGAHLAQALRLADVALLGLLDLLAGIETGSDPARDASALDALRSPQLPDLVRAEVHQAAGMIMVQAAVPIDQALARLRARAFQTDRPIREVALDVLFRRISFAAGPDSAE